MQCFYDIAILGFKKIQVNPVKGRELNYENEKVQIFQKRIIERQER